MDAKQVTKAALDKSITKMIRYSDKAPKSLKRQLAMGGVKEVKKPKMKLPWGLIFLAGVFIIAIIVFILWKSKSGETEGGMVPGEKLDEPIDLKGRDIKGLLDDFGYK